MSGRVFEQTAESGENTAVHGKETDPNVGSILRLQRLAGNSSVAQLIENELDESPVKKVIESGEGSHLDEKTREAMESKMGIDFGDVRVHTDSQAASSARSLIAQAYTVGTDIVFGEGKYRPGTSDGDRMIAHELTHVVQQRAGPVDGTPVGGGISLSSPDDKFEKAAEENAEHVMNSDEEEFEEE
ncbi:MAG: DUF4157 domain-containing protein [Acidimicrobiia bacterium]